MQLEHALNPITALAFVEVRRRLLLLAGEGPCLKVFDYEAGKLISAEKVFDTQAIHGIAILQGEASESAGNASVTCLIWGGRSICVIELANREEITVARGLQLRVVFQESTLSDWVLDAAFRPSKSGQQDGTAEICKIVLLTSHNVLFSLQHSVNLEHPAVATPKIKELAAGSRSVLYSAHIVWTTLQRLLIAAGTVFGEVLLWSTEVPNIPGDAAVSASSRLIHTFLGHEGSVFGVRISQPLGGESIESGKRILASCSDDRTIRIWDISDIDIADHLDRLRQKSNPQIHDTGFGIDPVDADKNANVCLAKNMGHDSRIWGLRFVSQNSGLWNLLSYGEDSTTQTWQLVRADMVTGNGTHTLSHNSAYAFHSGKNVWASDVFQWRDDNCVVATGGADGRIVCYVIPSGYSSRSCSDVRCSWTIQEALENAGAAAYQPNSKSGDRDIPTLAHDLISKIAVFANLKGKWQLTRQIKSINPSYPSGTFEGTAVFEERIPSDDSYDVEYLYVEDGEFKTSRDLSFSASRRYVYRYQALTDQISVWFVKPADGLTVDYQFLVLDFGEAIPTTFAQADVAIDARGYHLCIDDDYHVKYKFLSGEGVVSRWYLQYIVKGPTKNYTADAWYERESSYPMSSKTQKAFTVAKRTIKSTASSEDYRLFHIRQPKPDNFKTYSWLSRSTVLATTEHGFLLLGTARDKLQKSKTTGSHTYTHTPSVSWEVITQINKLSSYSIMSSIEGHEIAVFTGNEGTIYLYRHQDRSIKTIAKLQHKVSGLFSEAVVQNHGNGTTNSRGSLSVSILAFCLGSVTAQVWVTDLSSNSPESQDLPYCSHYEIDLPSTFIVTSSCFFLSLSLVILGSRSGSISLYDTSRDSDPVPSSSCNRRVHGEDAVTNIKPLPIPQSRKTFYFLTTGRDGKCAVHCAQSCEEETGISVWKLQIMHIITPPFGPSIEGATFDVTSHDLVLWGFRSKYFVVWNASTDMETVVVECGGSHRSCAYSPSNTGGGGGNFIWTKASTCNIHTQEQASHRVFQYGGHGREIKALTVSTMVIDGDGVDRRLIATGAEDTAIRVFAYERSPDLSRKSSRCYGIFTKHVTGIQQLRWSPNGRHLFSAAGCEEFFAWRIRQIPYFGFGVVCEAICSPVTEAADLRIMGFDIDNVGSETPNERDEYILSTVYSDSSLRVSFASVKNSNRC